MARSPSPTKKKRLIIIYAFAILLLLVVIAGAGAYIWYSHAVSANADGGNAPLELKVAAGDTLMDIAPKIQKAGGIISLEAFRVYVRLNNVNVPLQVGTYSIPLNQTIPGLIAELQNGPELFSVSVTIREGMRADEIADQMALAFKDVKHSAFSSEDFMAIVNSPDSQAFPAEITAFLNTYKPQGKPLEGFLFPDTYNIGTDAQAVDVVNLMINNLIARLKENNINPTSVGSISDFYSTLTYASVVEKEAFDLPEKKMVADIFIRRVTQGYGLGSDATILYPYKRWSPPPTASELQSDTAYNSRLHYGLPPTPIANPGIDSIKAVANPTPNDYYYFLHGPDGTIHYARTLAEHNQNINLYL